MRIILFILLCLIAKQASASGFKVIGDELALRLNVDKVDIALDKTSDKRLQTLPEGAVAVLRAFTLDTDDKAFTARISIRGADMAGFSVQGVYRLPKGVTPQPIQAIEAAKTAPEADDDAEPASVQLPVLVRPVPRGQAITADDVMMKEFAHNRHNRYITTASTVVGQALKRSIRPGRALKETDLTLPTVINKRDTVMLQVRTANMVLSMPGTAMEDGQLGKNIRVLNMSSKKTVVGEVVSPDLVVVRPFNNFQVAEK